MKPFSRRLLREVQEILDGHEVLKRWHKWHADRAIRTPVFPVIPEENTTFEDFLLNDDNAFSLTPPANLRVPPFQHQKEAMQWMIWRELNEVKGGILADEMGLGKTYTCALLILKQKEIFNLLNLPKTQTLIATPAHLIPHWYKELRRYLEPKSLILCEYRDSNRPSSIKQLMKFDVVIVSYNILRKEVEKKDLLFQVPWGRLILDEGHRVRDKKTKLYKAITTLNASSRFIVTATPVQNNMQDIYSLLKVINMDIRLPIDRASKNPSLLRPYLYEVMLRRSVQNIQKRNLEMSIPPIELHVIHGKLDGLHKSLYEILLTFMKPMYNVLFSKVNYKVPRISQCYRNGESPLQWAIKETYGDKMKNCSRITLPMLTRIQQLAQHPGLLKTKDSKGSCNVDKFMHNLLMNAPPELREIIGNSAVRTWKIDYSVNLIQEIMEKNEKVVVFSQWAEHLEILKSHLHDKGHTDYEYSDGRIDFAARNRITDAFNFKDSPRILLCTLDSMNEGVNLIGGNNVILLDLHWNPHRSIQAYGRTQRIGQRKPVHVYQLITKGTIEDNIEMKNKVKLILAEKINSMSMEKHPVS